MAKLRIEFVRLDGRGQVAEVLGEGETLDVSGVSAQAAAPDFGVRAGQMVAAHARLTALDSPVAVAVGANPTAVAADGLRIAPGQAQIVSVPPGQRLAAITAERAGGLPTQSSIITLSATLTRPDNGTAYAAGDAIGTADNVLFTFDFAAQGLPAGIILGARLIRQETTNTAARFRAFVHDGLPPTLPSGDNAPHPLLWANRASRRGIIDFSSPITTDASSGDACLDYEGVELSTRPIRFAGDGIVRVILTTRDAFTPVASRGYMILLDAGA